MKVAAASAASRPTACSRAARCGSADSERAEVVRIDPDTRRGDRADPAGTGTSRRHRAPGTARLWLRHRGARDIDDGPGWSRSTRVEPGRRPPLRRPARGRRARRRRRAVWVDAACDRGQSARPASTPAPARPDPATPASGTRRDSVAGGWRVGAGSQNGTRRPASTRRSGRIAAPLAAARRPATADGQPTAIAADADRGLGARAAERTRIFRLEGERVTRDRGRDSRQLAAGHHRAPATASGSPPATSSAAASARRADRSAPPARRPRASTSGTHRPRALVPVPGGLWVVAGDGTAVLIDT